MDNQNILRAAINLIKQHVIEIDPFNIIDLNMNCFNTINTLIRENFIEIVTTKII